MNPDPEFMRNFVPGRFWNEYQREDAAAERAVEAYKGHLRAQVEKLETFHNMVWKQDVLSLLGPE